MLKIFLGALLVGEFQASRSGESVRCSRHDFEGICKTFDAFVVQGFVHIFFQDGMYARGRWLYRGYLVGGRLAGRWRDTMTPLGMEGYEGSFELALRG